MGGDFSLVKYGSHIKEARERVKIANSFQEPDRVPILISDAGSYWSNLFGYNIKDYYTDFEVAVEVQMKGMKWRLENLTDDRTSYSFRFDLGPVAEGLYFGCPIERPDGTSPRIIHILHSVEDIHKFQVPDPAQSPGVKEYLRLFGEFQSVAKEKGRGFPVPSRARLGIHPPLSSACAIMPPDLVYEYLYTEPEAIKLLFEKMFEAFCRLVDHFDEFYGVKTTSLGLADDNSCFISPHLYRKMVLPYNLRLYRRYGIRRRSMHTDGPSDHLFGMLAQDLKLNHMDIGGFSSIDAAVRHMKGKVVIHGGLNCKDLYGDFDHEVKAKIDEALRVAAPGGGYEFAIGGETYPGVNPDTLVKVVEYVKDKGRYR